MPKGGAEISVRLTGPGFEGKDDEYAAKRGIPVAGTSRFLNFTHSGTDMVSV